MQQKEFKWREQGDVRHEKERGVKERLGDWERVKENGEAE